MDDKFLWTDSGNGGSWSDPDNWDHTLSGQNPATAPPGSSDDVAARLDSPPIAIYY